MSRETMKLVVGLSILAVCGTAASARQAPAVEVAPQVQAVPAEATPVPLTIVDPNTRPRSTGPTMLIRRDLQTGAVTQIPLAEAGATVQDAVQALLAGGSAEAFMAQVQQALAQAEDPGTLPNPGISEFAEEITLMNRGMNSRTLVTNTSTSPNSRSCKVSFNFGSSSFVGSAIMIDSKWAMTAGHCVHSSDSPQGGAPANTWASNFVVYPGYNNGANPAFGTARAVSMVTLSGWANSHDWDQDIGFVELDRPVGALSGWAGFSAFNGETGLVFSGTTYNYKGYPATSGYDGQRMYTRTGDFDMSWGHTYYTAANSIPGESGSGFTRTNGVAQAVLSHGMSVAGLGLGTGATAVWSSLYNDIQNNRILARTPVAADLIPLAVRTATTSKARNGLIPSVQVLLHNYSRSSFVGTPIISMRTSSNDLITTADPQGSLHSAGYMTIAPKASRWVTLYNVRVSPSSPIGNVYLGAIINNVDANTSNNATSAQDTDRLLVN